MTDDENWYGDDAATFGDRVTAAREALGLTDRQLASRLGIALRTLQNWEADTAEPRANKLQTLSGVLNVSMGWLLTGEGEGVAPPDTGPDTGPDAGEAPAEMPELLAEIRQLRTDAMQTAERLGQLEKRLKLALKEAV